MRLPRVMKSLVFLLGVLWIACAPTIPAQRSGGTGGPGSGNATGAADCQTTTLRNPATVYCGLMGYSTEIVETPAGQAGVCLLPDGSNCDEWAFLAGKCGRKYSYCAAHGYGIETRTDGADAFTQEYAVCIDSKGGVIGLVSELSGLNARLHCN